MLTSSLVMVHFTEQALMKTTSPGAKSWRQKPESHCSLMQPGYSGFWISSEGAWGLGMLGWHSAVMPQKAPLGSPGT